MSLSTKEGFVFVEWTGLPDTMPAAAVTVTAVYEEVVDEEFIASEEVTPERSDELTPQLPNRGVATPILIPTIVLPPNPEPVITRVRVNGSVVDVSIIPGQPVGELPQATLDGYLFQGWMNAITGEMITPETIILNPDYIVFAPIFVQAPSMIDAARNVFQSLLVNPFTTLTKTNDLTTRTDNIHSSRSNANGQPTSIDLRGGLIAVINNNGSVTIALPNERIPITLSVRGLDAVTLQVYYSIGEAAPEFDAPTWLTYTGEPFLTSAQGQSVFMMVKDAYDTHQVSYLRPATFVANLERIPTISAIKADDMTLLTNTNEHSFLTTIEYEDSMVDMFVIEPSGATQLEQVIVRYRANTHNTSLLLNVEAMTWREEIVPVGSSLGVYLRSGDNLDFELEYRFTGQASITETFQIAYDGESIGVFLAVGPNGFLRVLLGVLILTAMIAPYVVNPKPKKNMSV